MTDAEKLEAARAEVAKVLQSNREPRVRIHLLLACAQLYTASMMLRDAELWPEENTK